MTTKTPRGGHIDRCLRRVESGISSPVDDFDRELCMVQFGRAAAPMGRTTVRSAGGILRVEPSGCLDAGPKLPKETQVRYAVDISPELRWLCLPKLCVFAMLWPTPSSGSPSRAERVAGSA